MKLAILMEVNGNVQITQCRCYYDFLRFIQLDNYIYDQMLIIKGYQTIFHLDNGQILN
jgi:hypothetical protein